ncbi:alanine racemase [bacterium]|nr:alanine racemase [bacterium]
MNRVSINLPALLQNIQVIDGWMKDHGASWTLVTKVLCGHTDTIKALQSLGIRSMADSRLENLENIDSIVPDVESWYLRLPHKSAIEHVIRLVDVSLNSEMEIIEAINEEAKKQNKVHRIIVMIELGDLREGILPGTLVQFYREVFNLSNIEVLGIGANLGCLSGAVPNIDQMMQLVLYRELLELKFERKLPMISAGASAMLPLLLEGRVPSSVNNFRIGEAVFLGSDLVNGGTLKGLRDDAFILESEIIEIKEKSLVPMGETTDMTPFESIKQDDESFEPGQRGYRALIAVGQLDTDVSGLTPLNPDYRIAGASSDVSVINIGVDSAGLKVGDTIKFKPSYSALVRLMLGNYVRKEVTPPIDSFRSEIEIDHEMELPPVDEQVDETDITTTG